MVTEDSLEQVHQKFLNAKSAQGAWREVPLQKKLQAVKKFSDLVEDRKEKLAKILTEEMGKPITQSRNELNGLKGRIDFFLENTEKTLYPETVFSEEKKLEEVITHEPLGVISNISAWNYPYFVGSNVFIPALLTGNTVLYKPSEFATLTGLAIADLLHEAGVPKDVFIPVVGAGKTGQYLLQQKLNGIFFTGSYATGKKISEMAAPQLMKVQLELGGKDPVYVCEDVDVASAAAGTADGAMYNTGQSCCSVERIYVQEKIYLKFLDAFVETVKGFSMGDPMDEKTYIGRLTRGELQIEVLEKQVQDALSKGAKLLTGGKRAQRKGGAFFEPTVFSDVNHTMELMREESFGPIIGIQKVASDEQALALMNDTEYGLTASVYCKDPERARKILEKVHAGSAYWNCCDRVSPRLPWSGRGHSGIGSTLSKLGILTFTQPKAWHRRYPT